MVKSPDPIELHIDKEIQKNKFESGVKAQQHHHPVFISVIIKR
jgi:hypothetical protein